MAGRRINPILGLAGSALVVLFARTGLRAQQNGGTPVPVPSPPTARAELQPATAPLEERIAAARSVKVMTSILGIELGSDLDEAREKLEKFLAPGTKPKEEGNDDDEAKEREEKERESGEKKAGAENEQRERRPKDGEEDDEGYKALWQLTGTDYSAIYLTASDKEHIDSITGFLRPEKQMTYDQIGDVSKAPAKDAGTVVWDVLRPEKPLFRVVVKGTNGKASSIRLFVVRRKTGGVILYHGKPEVSPH